MNNLELFKVYEFDRKVRCGVNCDGGYVIGMLEPFQNTYDCYISAGVSNEESFTRDFLNLYKLNSKDCYAFDGTIDTYPYQYTSNITFIKKNISFYNDSLHTNLKDIIEKYDNIFLKMDIEGSEYNWLSSLSFTQLNKFKQIVMEFHGVTNNGWGCSYGNKVECLEKLSKTHYIIHAHGNNYSFAINGFPDVIELTFVNKKYFKDVPSFNKIPFPLSGLDFPNNPRACDIKLDMYPFVSLKTV